jgi:hypothetical protein
MQNFPVSAANPQLQGAAQKLILLRAIREDRYFHRYDFGQH